MHCPFACPQFLTLIFPLTCAQTLRFFIWLLVKAFPGAIEPAFSFKPVPELLSLGIDVSTDDVLHNLVTKESQLMKGSTPWRGAREKDPLLIQMLIESTTSPRDLVLDCTASTGMSLKACIDFTSIHLSFSFAQYFSSSSED